MGGLDTPPSPAVAVDHMKAKAKNTKKGRYNKAKSAIQNTQVEISQSINGVGSISITEATDKPSRPQTRQASRRRGIFDLPAINSTENESTNSETVDTDDTKGGTASCQLQSLPHVRAVTPSPHLRFQPAGSRITLSLRTRPLKTTPSDNMAPTAATSSPLGQSQSTMTPQSSAPALDLPAAEKSSPTRKPSSSQDGSSASTPLTTSSNPPTRVHGRRLSGLTSNQVVSAEETAKKIDEANTKMLVKIMALQEKLVPKLKRVKEIEAGKYGIQQGDVGDDGGAKENGDDDAAVKPAAKKTVKAVPIDQSLPKGTRQSTRMNRNNRQAEEAAKIKREADEKAARVQKAKNAAEEYAKKRNVTIKVTAAEHAEYLKLAAEIHKITAEIGRLEKSIASTKTSNSAAWVLNIAERQEVADALLTNDLDDHNGENRGIEAFAKGKAKVTAGKKLKIHGLAKEGGKAIKYVPSGAEDSMTAGFEKPTPVEQKPYGNY